MRELKVSYNIWNQVVQNNNFTPYHIFDGYHTGKLGAGNRDFIYYSSLEVDDYGSWVDNFSESSVLVYELDDIIAQIIGLSGIKETAHTGDNVLRVSSEKPTEGSKLTIISQDWGDPCTWYYKSRKVLDGYQLNNTNSEIEKLAGTYTEYEGYGVWVDNFHGRYSDEDELTNDLGEWPRLKVYVDGYEKVEVHPHTGVGDYTVDYENAKITFNETIGSSAVVTVDAWLAEDSTWSIIPAAGTKIIIDYVEVQFSADIKITDSVIFQPWVYNPYDLPNKVPYGEPTVYKTMKDYINEANRSYPNILKSTNENLGWRDLDTNYAVYVWDYQSSLEINSSVGAEIRIKLEHNERFEGSATAAFYCRVFDV